MHTQEPDMRTKAPAPMRSGRAEEPPTVVIPLATVQHPYRYDHPELGAQEKVDPEAAVRRILSAHQTASGNSTHAARMMGLTYQGLRRSIRRFDSPRMCADGIARMIVVDLGDGASPVPLNDALEHLRTAPNRSVLEADARALLSVAVGNRIRLADVARRANVDATRLTKFRARTGSLQISEINTLMIVIHELQAEPFAPKPGRRAAAA